MIILSKKLDIKSKHSLTIINHLRSAGGQARLIGGAVRDYLLGLNPKDIDIATDFTPDQVTEILLDQNIKVIPTGIKFGTVTALLHEEHFEITTLRRDLSCDGRRANVEYSKDFAEDAERRDFTINALSYCPIEHKIYDYFGGIEDLKKSKVVFIGDAEKRIQEDYLRILRFFRFSCYYAKNIDNHGLRACSLYKNKLKQLSRERIKLETDNLLQHEKSPEILQIMFESDILSEIFPIKHYNHEMHLKAWDVFQQLNIEIDLAVIYAILFQDSEKISIKYLLELKFSRRESRLIQDLLQIKNLSNDLEITYQLKKIWVKQEEYQAYFAFLATLTTNNQFIFGLYKKLHTKSPPIFPINGNDLQDLGYKDIAIGKMLTKLEIDWINSDFSLNKEELIKLIRNYEK